MEEEQNEEVRIIVGGALSPGEYTLVPADELPDDTLEEDNEEEDFEEPDELDDPEPDDLEPDPDPDPTPSTRPDLGARGLAQNNAFKGPYAPPVSAMPAITYLGGFTIPRDDFGVSSIRNTKGGFSVKGNTLWACGDRTLGRSFAPFEIPPLEFDPSAAVARNLAPFVSIGGRNGDDLTQVFQLDDGRIVLSNATRYDGSRSNRCFLHVMNPDGSGRNPCLNLWGNGAPEWSPQMSAGSIFKVPQSLRSEFGELCMSGEHWLSIISRVSCGPSVTSINPDDFNFEKRGASVTPHMYYPHKRTVGQHGSSGVRWNEETGLWEVAQGVSNPIFNRLTKYEVSFFWGDSYISIGLAAGQKHGDWYGPRNDQPRTHVQRGTHTGTDDEMPVGRAADGWPITPGKSKNIGDYSNYYWLTPISEIRDANRPWSPEPSEWGYFNPLLPEGQRPGWIRGAFFDSDTNRLYLMTGRGVVRVYGLGQ